MISSRRRSPLAPSRVVIPSEDQVQVWSLAFSGRASAPANAQLQQRRDHLAGCGIAFLDLLDAAEGESLRRARARARRAGRGGRRATARARTAWRRAVRAA